MLNRALLLLALLGLLAWWSWPQLTPHLAALQRQAIDTPALQPKAEPPVRCRAANGGLHYRQGRCEGGEQQEAMKGGTVTVLAPVPGTAAAPASSVASQAPALRRLADPAGTAEMQRKAQERIEGAAR